MEQGNNPRSDVDGEAELRSLLLERIQKRRKLIAAFVYQREPRVSRLARLTVLSTTLSAALTVGPGVGGDSFVNTVQTTLGLSAPSRVWQVLCLLAVAASGLAALWTKMSGSADLTEHLSSARAANFELDGLITMLEFHDIGVDTAVKLFQEYLSRIPFVED